MCEQVLTCIQNGSIMFQQQLTKPKKTRCGRDFATCRVYVIFARSLSAARLVCEDLPEGEKDTIVTGEFSLASFEPAATIEIKLPSSASQTETSVPLQWTYVLPSFEYWKHVPASLANTTSPLCGGPLKISSCEGETAVQQTWV
jgi:hypothetical protein